VQEEPTSPPLPGYVSPVSTSSILNDGQEFRVETVEADSNEREIADHNWLSLIDDESFLEIAASIYTRYS